MAQSSNAFSFDPEAEYADSYELDNTCPDCNTESIVSYLDRYSSFEYCTNCDWSDEEEDTDEQDTSKSRKYRPSREA